MRKASEAAYDLIRQFEGLRLKAYPDSAGVWTIGYGHTDGVNVGDTVTEEGAELLLHDDVAEAVATITRYVPASRIDSWPQACFDALVSFVFNLGPQAFVNSRGGYTHFFEVVIGPDLEEVPRQMQRWVKARVNGKLTVLPGLVRRRGAEAALWGAGLESMGTMNTAHHALAKGGSVEPVPPQTKLMERPGTVVAAGAGAAGVAATALTTAGQHMTLGGNTAALVLGVVLILVGAGIMLWIAKE